MAKKRQQSQQSQQNNRTTLDNIINDALKNLKNIIDINTVVGDEIKTSDGTIVIPITKIIVGFVAGGGEVTPKAHSKIESDNYPFSGASGTGFTVVPVGFLTGKNGNLSFVSVKSDTKYDELINLTNKSLKLIIDSFQVNRSK